jgi:hypothetical protein
MSSQQLKLPDFFPATVVQCSTVSQEFFDCFTKMSEKQTPDDSEAGIRGLAACKKEMGAYEACMNKNIPKVVKGDKNFRVSDDNFSCDFF